MGKIFRCTRTLLEFYFAAIAGPFTSALAHGSNRSSSPLPLENSTDTEGKVAPVLLTQHLLYCEKRKSF